MRSNNEVGRVSILGQIGSVYINVFFWSRQPPKGEAATKRKPKGVIIAKNLKKYVKHPHKQGLEHGFLSKRWPGRELLTARKDTTLFLGPEDFRVFFRARLWAGSNHFSLVRSPKCTCSNVDKPTNSWATSLIFIFYSNFKLNFSNSIF